MSCANLALNSSAVIAGKEGLRPPAIMPLLMGSRRNVLASDATNSTSARRLIRCDELLHRLGVTESKGTL